MSHLLEVSLLEVSLEVSPLEVSKDLLFLRCQRICLFEVSFEVSKDLGDVGAC